MKRLKTQLLALIFIGMLLVGCVGTCVLGYQCIHTKRQWQNYKETLNKKLFDASEEKMRSLLRILLLFCEQKDNELRALAMERLQHLHKAFEFHYRSLNKESVLLKDHWLVNQWTRNPEQLNFRFWGESMDEKSLRQVWEKLGECKGSLLQRINASGDIVRFASNRSNEALATYLPSVGENGQSTPGTKALLSGMSHWGTERFLDRYFLTYSAPFLDPELNQCVGACEICFEEKAILQSIESLVLSQEDNQQLAFQIFRMDENKVGSCVFSSDKDYSRFYLDKWQDSKGRTFLVDMLKELQSSKNYSKRSGMFNQVYKSVNLKAEGKTETHDYLFRMAYFREWNWIIVLSMNGTRLLALNHNLNDTLFNLDGLFKQTAFLMLGSLFLCILFFVKIAGGRLSRLEEHWLRLQNVLQRILNQDLKGEVYDDFIHEHSQLAYLVKTGVEVSGMLRKYLSEERNFAQDMHHTLDNLISNFQSSQKIHTGLGKTHANVAGGFDQIYAKLKKAEDGSVVLAKALTRVRDLQLTLENRYDSVVDIQRKETAQLQRIKVEVKESMKVLDTLKNATENIIKTKELLLGLSEQTNLLALNATIEASVDGGSGKGFSIVADEVKELSKKTASSTQAIDHEVDNLQKASGLVVEKVKLLRTLSEDGEQIFSQLTEAGERQNETMKEWLIQVFQWSEVVEPLVSVIKEFIGGVEVAHKDLEKMMGGFERNRQYLKAIENDLESLRYNLDELNRLLLGWAIES